MGKRRAGRGQAMEWEARILKLAEEAVSREGILALLRTAACNPGLGYANLLLVNGQGLEAGPFCGRKAWEAMGRSVNHGTEGLILLLPKLYLEDGKYRYSLLPIKTYGAADTNGEEFPVQPVGIPFVDRITQKTGTAWEAAGTDGKGWYDGERHVFCLPKRCGGEQMERACLEVYVDYCLQQEGESDQMLRLTVCYVLFERYHVKHTIIGALFRKLGEKSLEEKVYFLQCACGLAAGILADLEGETLSFHETAILNDVLISGERESICRILVQVGEDLAGTAIEKEIRDLKEKLSRTKPGCIRKLWKLRMERRLYSYPLVVLEMEERWLVERRKF